MRIFAAGLLLGLVIGGSATAIAAGVFGTGALNGWTVRHAGHLSAKFWGIASIPVGEAA
jgi:hypothetical protein